MVPIKSLRNGAKPDGPSFKLPMLSRRVVLLLNAVTVPGSFGLVNDERKYYYGRHGVQ